MKKNYLFRSTLPRLRNALDKLTSIKAKKRKHSSGAAKKAIDFVKDLPEPHFGGLSESTLTKLASETYKGQRVKILGERALEYYYRSNRGREQQVTKFYIDELGNLVRGVGMGPYASANSPRFFQEKLSEALKAVKK